MKKFNPLFYLLFIMLIMGAFASMAQNGYGQKIMGGASFAFGLVFLYESISVLKRRKEGKNLPFFIEAFSLFVLSFLFAFRLLYIHFSYVEEIFAVVGIILAGLYTGRMVKRYRLLVRVNVSLARLTLVYHLSLVLFLLSLVFMPFASGWAEKGGLAAFLLLILFLLLAASGRKYLVEGENISAFSMIRHLPDHSIIIVSLFLMFTLYVGLNRIGLLPSIYSDEYPQEYFKLVDKAASGKEKPENGKYKHEQFKEQYELFLQHHKDGQ